MRLVGRIETFAQHSDYVTPAQAGVQNALNSLDSRLRGNDIEDIMQKSRILSASPNARLVRGKELLA